MSTFFLVCALLGGGLLLLELLLSVVGVGAEIGLDKDVGHTGFSEGLDLFSVRALTAGVAFFGVAGLAGLAIGLPGIIALVPAAGTGFAAMAGVAWVLRWFGRLESDGTVHIEDALGERATVYLTIPGDMAASGKVHVVIQGRLLEVQAVTRHGEPLPTGSEVIVTDLRGTDTLEVIPVTSPTTEVV